MLERIAELVSEKKIEGISDIRDESDKDGIRVVIELKRGEVPEVILNNLYKNTQLQDTFGINMVALVDGQPRLLNLRDLIFYFLRHRREVITRRTVFELRKARDRGHVLEGLAVALANIDEFIAIIKAAPTPPLRKLIWWPKAGIPPSFAKCCRALNWAIPVVRKHSARKVCLPAWGYKTTACTA